MRTIAIINQKGGCGKTTTAINLASVLANQGRRTLLVDMDPQSHCALGLAVPEGQLERTVGDLLRAGMDGSVTFPDIIWQITKHLDLAPSSIALAALEHELITATDKDRRLVQVLSTVSDLYEFCIIDCPPSIGLLTFNALRAAGEVIIPVETGYFALRGAIKQQATIEMLARRVSHQVRFSVLATMYDVRTKLAREILAEMKRHFGEQLLPVVVHFNARLKEAASFGQAITEYDPESTGHEDFLKLAQWLMNNAPTAAAAGESAQAVVMNPALSRAAELVERARALSARTAMISNKLNAQTRQVLSPMQVAAKETLSAAGSQDVLAQAALASPSVPSPAEAPLVPFPLISPPLTPAPVASTLVEQPSPSPVTSPKLNDRLTKLYGVRSTSQGLLFIQPKGDTRTLAIAGDFNQWQPERSPMRLNTQLGVWQACIQMPAGRYRYRLVVDGQWMHDAHNPQSETNPFGELNSIIEVEAAVPLAAEPSGDTMAFSSLPVHEPLAASGH